MGFASREIFPLEIFTTFFYSLVFFYDHILLHSSIFILCQCGIYCDVLCFIRKARVEYWCTTFLLPYAYARRFNKEVALIYFLQDSKWQKTYLKAYLGVIKTIVFKYANNFLNGFKNHCINWNIGFLLIQIEMVFPNALTKLINRSSNHTEHIGKEVSWKECCSENNV